jgi:hypothetical protein
MLISPLTQQQLFADWQAVRHAQMIMLGGMIIRVNLYCFMMSNKDHLDRNSCWHFDCEIVFAVSNDEKHAHEDKQWRFPPHGSRYQIPGSDQIKDIICNQSVEDPIGQQFT